MDRVDAIGCMDARGFLFAPYLGVHFRKPVFMLRKPDKMPSVEHTVEYFKEYKGDSSGGGDFLSIQTYAVKKGDRVLLVDDLLATGGTCEAAIHLIQQAGASVTACTFVVEISGLNGRGRASKTSTNEQIRFILLLTEKDF
uniref:adenine phosphoribosyltransferase n=1 Tax=Hyaloperonospora arabidopsidis (strain Emoy2) TaxID=559515 RepID=M4C3D8_HYAAE